VKLKKSKKPFTTDFWGDVFEGGYIKPDELCVSRADAERVNAAVSVLEEFRASFEETYPEGIG